MLRLVSPVDGVNERISMKSKLLVLPLFVTLLAGCTSIDYTGADGAHLKAESFATFKAFEELKVGEAYLKGYSNDQISGLKAAVDAAVKAGIEASTP